MIMSLCATIRKSCAVSAMCSIPDESVKEQCGVADNTRGAGLLVLAAL